MGLTGRVSDRKYIQHIAKFYLKMVVHFIVSVLVSVLPYSDKNKLQTSNKSVMTATACTLLRVK